jgi:hypothetical protein
MSIARFGAAAVLMLGVATGAQAAFAAPTAPAGGAQRAMSTSCAGGFSLPSSAVVGTVLQNVPVEAGLTASTVTVTASANGTITGTAGLTPKGSSTSMNATFVWSNSCNWSFNITRATDPNAPASTVSPTGLDVRNVSGTIMSVAGKREAQLTLEGYTLAGNAPVNLALRVTPQGFEGSAEVRNYVVGGITYPRVKLSLSTLRSAVRLEGEMSSSFGDYTVDTSITAAGGDFQQSLKVTGANLPVQKDARFKLLEFTFSKDFSYAASGCASFAVDFSGSMEAGNKTYTLRAGRFAMSCNKVTEFKFHVAFEHYEAWSGSKKEGTLYVHYFANEGTTNVDVSHQEANGQLTSTDDAVHYKRGLIGTFQLTQSRKFRVNRKAPLDDFERTVTIGMKFGFAVLVEHDNKMYAYIGAGGGIDTSRVSGRIGCIFQAAPSTDFGCGVELVIDLPWKKQDTRHYWGSL